MRKNVSGGPGPAPPSLSRAGLPIPLATPLRSTPGSLDHCLRTRRSTREYAPEPLTLAEVAQLLWAAQGVTAPAGLRTAPSPGAVYPLRLYLASGRVAGLDPAIYRYDPDAHAIRMTAPGDARGPLSCAALGQQCAADCAAIVAIAASYRRLTREFGAHARRLALIEAGHVGQNVCLQATALGLGCVGLGRFEIELAHDALHLPDSEEPLFLIAVGRKPAA
jgi:SagB-type dehydrogenase family enzyme